MDCSRSFASNPRRFRASTIATWNPSRISKMIDFTERSQEPSSKVLRNLRGVPFLGASRFWDRRRFRASTIATRNSESFARLDYLSLRTKPYVFVT
jgi:hypothetical protein